MNLIEVKVRYSKETGNGKKKVTEKYLVDAMTFGEAEAKVVKDFTELNFDEFSVEAIKKSNYTDQLLTNENNLYEVKVHFIIVDEKSGKEKQKNEFYLVQANCLQLAADHINKKLKDVMDVEIVAIFKTNIIDIITDEE